jgi:hypothetical protein
MQGDPRHPTDAAPGAPIAAHNDDERAIARYLYLLRTASPEAIEQVHTEAFRTLTEAQRHELLERIGQVLPPYERALATPANGTPVGLARLITRAEMRQPGTVARLFGPGAGVGSLVASSLLGGIAGAVAVGVFAAPFLAGAALAAVQIPDAPPTSGIPVSGDDGTADDAFVAEGAAADDAVADTGSVDGTGFDLGFELGLDDLFDI